MKTKFPRAEALKAAKEICDALKPATEKLIVAGSLRRRKLEVGDVEILYVPKFDYIRVDDLFPMLQNMADLAIDALERSGFLRRRLNVNGAETFGAKNKLMLHTRTGIPVDLFEATLENWANYLVCRTGPAASNTRIASLAQARGWKWKPYSPGFCRLAPGPLGSMKETEEIQPMMEEADVFEFVGLPYLPPEARL